MDSPWYAVEVGEEVAPWIYERGKDQMFRWVAILELRGTLTGVILCGNQHGRRGSLITIGDSTDDLGISYVSHQPMTTKFRLDVILMQPCLTWTGRDQHQTSIGSGETTIKLHAD